LPALDTKTQTIIMFGLGWYIIGGDKSVLLKVITHHNRFGFYSSGVANIVLDDNHVDHNFMYGSFMYGNFMFDFDSHTETYDRIIRNNAVHDSGVCANNII